MIILAEDAVARDPTQVYPYTLLGQMYRHFDYDTSNRWLQEVLRYSPENAEALTLLAENALWQGRREEALNYLDRARHGHVERASVYSSMARLYEALGQPETAALLYQKAIGRYPDLSYFRALAGLYYRMGQYDKAKAEYEAILKRAPGDPEAQDRLRSIRELTGR